MGISLKKFTVRYLDTNNVPIEDVQVAALNHMHAHVVADHRRRQFPAGPEVNEVQILGGTSIKENAK